MPNGLFLGSPNPEFTRKVMIETYEPNPKELERTSYDWHNFWIDILNKTEDEITDEELDKYFPYLRDKVEYSKKCLIAFAHCKTCAKIKVIERYCPKCPYFLKQFIIGEK
jgi:hypothetical protein